MVRKKIGIDLDSVLARIMPPLIKFHNEVYGTDTKIDDHASYGLYEVWGVSQEESVDRVFEFYKSIYFDMIKPVDGSKEGVEYLKSKYDLVLITSRPTWLEDKSVEWVEKYFPGKFEKIVLTNQYSKDEKTVTKSQVCRAEGVEIMIDDAVEYAMDCHKNGIKVYLYDMPWNKDISLPDGMIRVYDWKEIQNFL